MLLAYNSPDWVVALWAIWSLGAVPVLGNRWWSPQEAAHSIALTAPRAVITDAPDLAAADGVAVLDIAEMRAEGATASGTPPRIPGPDAEDDPAVVLFTSGSSGMPKAV